MSRRCRALGLWAPAMLTIILVGGLSWAAPPATGPLKKCEANPRYFADGSGKPVLLVGSHNWHNFQDNGHRLPESQDPPPDFDYDTYLDFLDKHDHNFFRLWRWEAPKWTDAHPGVSSSIAGPIRGSARTRLGGRRQAEVRPVDVRPRVFRSDARRIIKARDRGIYVSIMLFEGWELQFTDAWKYHPFHGPNNVSGIDADPEGRGLLFNQLRDDPMGRKVLAPPGGVPPQGGRYGQRPRQRPLRGV